MFDQFVKHVESFPVKLSIIFPSLIYGILSTQKNDIVTSEDEDGAIPCVLKFNYKLFVGKHVDIVIYIVFIDGIGLNMDEDMLDMTPLFKLVISHILKALIHEANAM